MTQTVFFAIISLSICLVALLVRSVHAIIRDVLQHQRTVLNVSTQENAFTRQLTSKLRRTSIDLSMSRRQTPWREVMLVKIVQESVDVKSFYLIDGQHEPLPAAQPGQHILLERPKLGDLPAAFRCYSLSNDCSSGYWRISIKKNSEQAQSVSRWLHESTEIGDTLRVRGPSGNFFLRSEPSREVVFASAGIGLSPILPMLIEAIRRKNRAIRVYTQYRDVAHMPFADSLLSFASQHPRVQLSMWISRFPKGVNKSSGRFIHEGKFQAAEILSERQATRNCDYYLCGPEDWQSRMKQDLISGGVPENQIEYELFQQKERVAAGGSNLSPRTVHFKQSGATAVFDASHPSILGCASKNKLSLESGCRTGACGSCAIRLLRGKVRYTREPQFPLKSNEILPCVCVPETDLIVDA